MKKALIITYYWPPSGGGGVMRWLKMSKYLPEFGWQPVIYTPSNPDPSVWDESLLEEVPPEATVIRQPIWEPYNLYRFLTRQKKGTSFKAGYISEASGGGLKNRLAVFIRGNLFIPDPRKYWIHRSVKFLRKYLEKNPVDLVISTGPPHSMHLIALKLKKFNPAPWLADFRDPWTKIDFYDRLKLTHYADRKHKKLEAGVLKAADYIVTVSETWARDFNLLSGRNVEVITNGFDPADFRFPDLQTDPGFSLTHIGSFNRDRNPVSLWEVLKQIGDENPEFFNHLKIRLIGQTDSEVFKSIESNNLSRFLEKHDHLPHSQSLEYLKRSSLLLLPLNNTPNVSGIIPGKFYEYLAVQRPVLAIGPENGDCGKYLKQAGAGTICGFDDKEGLKKAVMRFFGLYLENRLFLPSFSADRFSRRNLAGQLVELLERNNL